MKSFFRSILGFLIALGGIVLLIEITLWMFHREGPEPVLNLTMKQTGLGEKSGVKPEIVYQQNELGLRGLNFNSPIKPAKTIRILVIGGSLANAPAQNLADTWLAKLEMKLNDAWKATGWKSEVASYAAKGIPTQEFVRWYREIGSGYKPDVVLTCVGIEDHIQAEQWISEGLTPQSVSAYCKKPYQFGLVSLSKFSQIYRHYHDLKAKREFIAVLDKTKKQNPALFELNKKRERYTKLPVVKSSQLSENRQSLFAAAAQELVAEITSSGAFPVAVGVPTLQSNTLSLEAQSKLRIPITVINSQDKKAYLQKMPPGEFRNELNLFNFVAKEKVEAKGGRYIDLFNQLEPTELNFLDDEIPTDEGNTNVANILFKELEPVLKTKFVK